MSEGPVRLPEISVLVPIYNVERYLAEWLDSLVAQTFTDFEVILINDGSTDGSRDIISRYLVADQRFRVIDKPISGYGASMNRGLDESLGTYVAILESDDFFVPDALKLLHDVAVREDSDVVKANFWLYWSVPEERREEFVIVTPEMAGRTMRPSSDEDKTIFYQKPSIWSALYRREFLTENAIRFLETPGASYQDASFNFKVWALAERASFIDDFILNYRQDNEASSVNSPGKVYCVCDEYAEMERFLEVRPALSERLRGVLTRMKFDSTWTSPCWVSIRRLTCASFLTSQSGSRRPSTAMAEGLWSRTSGTTLSWAARDWLRVWWQSVRSEVVREHSPLSHRAGVQRRGVSRRVPAKPC